MYAKCFKDYGKDNIKLIKVQFMKDLYDSFVLNIDEEIQDIKERKELWGEDFDEFYDTKSLAEEKMENCIRCVGYIEDDEEISMYWDYLTTISDDEWRNLLKGIVKLGRKYKNSK